MVVGMRRPAAALLGLVLFIVVAGCGGPPAESRTSSKPRVAAAFYPLAFVVKRIGRDGIELTNLTPPGAEPHDVELTSDQVVALSQADLLVYVGGGFQPAVEGAAGDAARAVDVLEAGEVRSAGASEAGRNDPHVWLNPAQMSEIAGVVADELSDIDPGRSSDYRRNAAELRDALAVLDRDFEQGLSDCRRRDLVASHTAFGHLAERYGLRQVGIAGLDPGSEPSPQRVAEIAEFVRARDVTTIFFEELLSPRLAETIAEETGARTAMLNPLESPPQRGDYLSAMRANLDALRAALGCR